MQIDKDAALQDWLDRVTVLTQANYVGEEPLADFMGSNFPTLCDFHELGYTVQEAVEEILDLDIGALDE